MNRLLRSIPRGPAVVIGLIALIALVGGLVMHEQKVRAREVVRAELDACRTAYLQGGVSGLRTYLSKQTPVEREENFVELLGKDKQAQVLESPQNEQDKLILSPLASDAAATHEWIRIPSAVHHSIWTVGRAPMPDGAILYVGHLAATQNQESE